MTHTAATIDLRPQILACRQGQRDAFRVIFESHYGAAFRLARFLLGDEADAHDATQEAFIKAYRNLGRFDVDRPLRPWLLRIVRNCAIDVQRRRQRAAHSREALRGLERQVEGRSPEGWARDAELARRLRTAIAALSPAHREVFVLREIEGLSYAEIAEVVGIPRGTVMSRLFHARRRLRRDLEDLL